MVFIMSLEVVRQLGDAFAKDSDLHLRAACVALMGAKALNNVGFFCRCQHGGYSSRIIDYTHVSVYLRVTWFAFVRLESVIVAGA